MASCLPHGRQSFHAGQLARLHSYELPEHLQPFHAEPGMWSQILGWHEQAKRTVPSIEARWGVDAAERFAATLTDHLGSSWERSSAELAELQAAIPKVCGEQGCSK